MKQKRLLLLLALLMTAATGAWAQEPETTTYSVKMKAGTEDAANWTIASGENSVTGDAADGLTGLSEGQTVTLQYNGRLKVKGVKATSDAAAPSVPDGAISGKFSVSDGKQVYFSKGNLRYASSKWSFFDNQYDYYTSYSADAWDKFGWSTSATTYGMSTSSSNGDYSGDFVDWGATMGTGWFTLSKDEWTYLFKTRSASTVGGTENGRYAKAKVNNVPGIILFPDTYTHPDGVTAPVGVNATGDTGWNGNSYTVADWTKMESAGCVFLPAAGYREGSSVTSPGSYGYYWSATPSGTNNAYRVYSNSRNLNPENTAYRRLGLSVRLVCEGATSDAPAVKPAATVTTAPTATTGDIAAGSETALVSGGAATGGTMMYKVTTANTKPTSTEGFSADVPTAKTLAAGTYYVWYYVKGDASHTDSEISATGIEVTIEAAGPAATPLDNTTTAWTAGTYAVPTGGLTYSDAITVSGDVTLVLTDGETLTLNKGISLASGATLTVEGNGTMNVNGTNDNTSSTVAGSGMMCFKSGTLVATGGNGHVGNDLGQFGMNGGISHGGSAINGSLTLEGGNVTATGGNGGNAGGASSINWATGGNGGSAITGNVIINGGNWTANNGSNGTLLSGGSNNVAGTGGKAVAGTVTDNRN